MGTHPIFESDFDCLTESEMAKGRKGKNNDDEEFDRIEAEMAAKKAAAAADKPIPDPASVSDFPSMESQSKKSKKKAKKNSLFADLENELDNPELVKKLEEADIEPVLSKSQQKKLKREQRKKGANIQLDSAGEEEEIPIPTKKGARNKGKASFADLVSDEEEESEEETPPPKKGNKGGKGKKGKGKASFADLMSDEEEEEEPVPAKGGKGKKNKGKNKGK